MNAFGDSLAEQHASCKRPRSPSTAAGTAHLSRSRMVQLLQTRPSAADAVLTCRHELQGPQLLTIVARLYDALPPELHAAAARGCFGVDDDQWVIDVSDAAMCASRRTLALLPQQARVTTLQVQLSGAAKRAKSALKCVQRAQHITSVEVFEIPGFLNGPLRWLTRLKNLRQLGLNGRASPLTFDTKLARTLKRLTCLETLAMDDVGALNHDAWLALARLTALTRLELCTIGFEGRGRGMRTVLASMRDLHALQICGGFARQWGCTLVGANIAACAALTKLDLESCGMRFQQPAARALLIISAPLRWLSLSGCRLGNAYVAELLANPAMRSLTHLDLKRVRLEGAHFMALSLPWVELCALKELQTLDLSDNHICDTGADTLVDRISALTQLRALDLTRCGMYKCDALAYAVCSLPSLTRLAVDGDPSVVGGNGRELREWYEAVVEECGAHLDICTPTPVWRQW